ncbi:Fur family transcriptional regulator [Eubacterium oxidoreducens]|uniref:Fur family transcriptional regulator, peroxide stress response regulator n=1 Tax=Eubacterium oxidoreducens TaxID=1732 RepID=A0A1G6CRP5_EUBOX|nr:Fur family transcriptional regulator, peroxide stress response regulator [Eubacterium oxidoreducens]
MHYSKQREAVKHYLQNHTTHPTAEMIYQDLKKTMPNISLGTVYRNLNLLVERGDAIKLDFGDGIDRFDGFTSPHYHFICNKCNRLFDLKMKHLEHINSLASIEFDGEIEGHIIYFHGTCPDCKTQM